MKMQPTNKLNKGEEGPDQITEHSTRSNSTDAAAGRDPATSLPDRALLDDDRGKRWCHISRLPPYNIKQPK